MNISNPLNESCFGLKSMVFKTTTSVVITAIGVSIFNVIFSLTAAVGNGIMLYILTTKHSLRSPSNLLVASLCVTDFLVGLIVQPLHVVSRIYETRNAHLCTVKLVYAYFAFVCSGASFLNMMLISIDRCYAISRPFRYTQTATMRKYGMAVCVVWLSWCCITMLPFVHVITPAQFSKITVASAGLAIVVIVFCYAVIFNISRNVQRRISADLSLGTFENSVSYHDNHNQRSGNNHPNQNIHIVQRKKEKRRSNTMAIVILALFLCYTPNIICILLESMYGFSLGLAYVAWHWTGLLVFFNSSLNPLIYCIRNRDIRRAVLGELKRRKDTMSSLR